MFKYSELDIDNIEKVVGQSYKDRMKEVLKLFKVSNTPIIFTGNSGTGKTIVAKNIASRYAKKNNVPAYFIQLSPDQTKTNIILGLRLINGSLQAQNGVVAECMEQGGIIVIDEATHATQSLLLMFNSLMDKDSITSIGDKIIKAKDTFRIIFCCNDSNYSGNIKLPQSFCNRPIAYHFDYPSFDEELEIAINMLDIKGVSYNEDVLTYFVRIMRELRGIDIPLSCRNIFSATLLLSTKKVIENKDIVIENDSEAKFKKIISLVRDYKVIDAITKNDILNEEKLINLFCSIGFENINEVIKQTFMYYLDFDGAVFSRDDYKNKLEGFLL